MELPLLPEPQPVIKKVHTSCKDCVFAVYDRTVSGVTQTDCKLGRVDQFLLRNPHSVVEAYDADREFFVINGRLCNAFRSSQSRWAGEHRDDPVAQVQKEIQLRMSALLLIEDGSSIEQVQATAAALVSQSLPPAEVIIVNNQTGLSMGTVMRELWRILDNKVTWRVTNVLPLNDVRPPRTRAIDLAVDQLKEGSWYGVFVAGYEPPATFIAGVHEALNVRMERFSLLTPLEDGSGLVVQVAMHRHPLVGGNEAVWAEVEGDAIVSEQPARLDETPTREVKRVHLGDIVAKLQHYASSNKLPWLVRDVREVALPIQS